VEKKAEGDEATALVLKHLNVDTDTQVITLEFVSQNVCVD